MEDKEKSKIENSNSQLLSIQAPPSSSAVTIMENQPRQPTSLHGLLKFAMDVTKNENAPNASHFQALDDERKQFLNDAFNSITVNVTEELQKCIKTLSNVMELIIEDSPTVYENALKCIASYVDSMDVAVDFYKMGGFGILGACLNSPHDSIRWRTADLIAELTQNNPYCQDKILQMGLLPILLSMIDTDPSDKVQIKALYAISCIVRGNDLSLKYMDVNNGFSVLINAMKSPIQKLQIKSAFLISALCSRDNAYSIGPSFIKMGIIEQASTLLASNDVAPEIREALLSILNSLTADNNLQVLKECRRPELTLKNTLERHLENLKLEEETDQIERCKMIIDRIFSDQHKEQD